MGGSGNFAMELGRLAENRSWHDRKPISMETEVPELSNDLSELSR